MCVYNVIYIEICSAVTYLEFDAFWPRTDAVIGPTHVGDITPLLPMTQVITVCLNHTDPRLSPQKVVMKTNSCLVVSNIFFNVPYYMG